MRKVLRTTAVLALPTVISAVHLSDMTPRAEGLPDACSDLYTATIPGCSSSDFSTLQCSQSCLSSLNAMVAPIVKACGGQGVQGQNLIVAFLNGIGPQQICHNADSFSTETTTTTPHTTQQSTTAKPSIVSSTTTARKPTDTESLLVDTSRTTTKTSSSRSTRSTQRPKPTKHTTSPEPSSSAAPITSSTVVVKTTSPTSSPTKTTTGGGNSETNLEDGSGGGSPFDTPGNLMNGAGLAIPALSVVLPAVAAALFAALR